MPNFDNWFIVIMGILGPFMVVMGIAAFMPSPKRMRGWFRRGE